MTSQLLNKWSKGVKSPGIWSNLPDIYLAELYARSGMDWICFDLQHGLMDVSDLYKLLPAITGLPITPIVRVAGNDTDQIGKVLDAGARGVIVPMVNGPADAERAVASCRYPPLGIRSCGPMRDAIIDGPEYLINANEQIACVVMIETEEGLANVESIAATKGVDGIFVGPMDLCFGLNIAPGDFGNEKFVSAVERIKLACHKYGCSLGMFGYTPELAADALQSGFTFVSIGTDISFARTGVEHAIGIACGRNDETSSEKEKSVGY